ncbi:MAG: hypothetical protein M3R24_04320 [Chloroflexota bacterium]|nr:hypothetical protein [Chloroflexota bacterium]
MFRLYAAVLQLRSKITAGQPGKQPAAIAHVPLAIKVLADGLQFIKDLR